MPKFIRVKATDTKHELSIPDTASREGFEVIDKPATHSDGTPLPPKYHVSLSDKSKPGQSADNKKES